MNKDKGIIKNTIVFLVAFAILTFLVYLAMGLVILGYTQTNLADFQTLDQDSISREDMDWGNLGNLADKGLYLDEEGRTLQAYGFEEAKASYSPRDLMDFSQIGNPDSTVLIYKVEEGGYFYLFYPKTLVENNLNVDLNQVLGDRAWIILLPLLFILVTYLVLVYLIIRFLSKRISKGLDRLYKEEEEKKDLVFRGLAHDVKTPLAGIIAYATAIKDGIVPKEEKEKYQEGIYRNALLLKDRVEEMKDLVALNQTQALQPVEADILEEIRRYVGDNYMWFADRQAKVRLAFSDHETYVTTFDPRLFSRLLQNILENSVQHNKPGVEIFVNFDKKNQTVIFKDSGPGIPENLQETMFEPMVTGDTSRTGDKFRGMGLANVKRIVDLHGWVITYKDAFYIRL